MLQLSEYFLANFFQGINSFIYNHLNNTSILYIILHSVKKDIIIIKIEQL